MAEAIIHVDGAIAGGQQSGAAAVAQNMDGRFLGWTSRQMPSMTNNEAEYQALLLGLSLARQLRLQTVVIHSDSEIVVRQMQGSSRVISPRLRILHQQSCVASRYFKKVTFHHVPREENRVADALAADALRGRIVGRTQKSGKLLRAIWRRVRKEK